MLDGCTVDDEMWYHALMTMARLESEVRPDLQNQHPEEWVLYQLIRQGVIDQDENWDKVFRPATRAMRYSASLADLLWVKINQERERVSVRTMVFTPDFSLLFRLTPFTFVNFSYPYDTNLFSYLSFILSYAFTLADHTMKKK